MTKQEFVDKILDIVTKYTTKFNIQAKTKSLTDLYEILDCEDQGSVSIYELLGAIIVIVKGTPDEKINALYNFIQTFKANDVILVYSGLINCALNGANGLNSKVFAEVFSEHVSSLNYNSEDFAQWVISSNVIHHEQDISVAQSVFDPRETYEAVTKLLLNNIKAMKDELHVQVRSLNILNALEIFKNNSMLGELNKRQLVTSIEEILSESIVSLQDHDRNEQIAKFVEMLSLDFNNSELFELVQLHPALFVLFEGSAEDKLQSFFQIMGTEDKIDVSDFSLMIRNIFKYAVRNLKVESIDEFVSAFVGEIAESRKTIELNSLIEFYYNIIQEES